MPVLPGGAHVGRRTLEWETRERKRNSSVRWQASWTPGGAWAMKVPLAEKGGYISRKSNLLFFLNILHKTHEGIHLLCVAGTLGNSDRRQDSLRAGCDPQHSE